MGLLELFVGPDAARQFRERVAEAAAARAEAARAEAGRAAQFGGARSMAPAVARPTTGSRATLKSAPGSGVPALARPPAVPPAPAAPSALDAPSVLAGPLELAALASGDFPTSILGTAAEAAPPLLSAFANRSTLLAAIVFSEALAPPVALR